MPEEVLMPRTGEVYVSPKRDSIYIVDVDVEDDADYVVFTIDEKNKGDLESGFYDDDCLSKEEWERFVWFYKLEKKAP